MNSKDRIFRRPISDEGTIEIIWQHSMEIMRSLNRNRNFHLISLRCIKQCNRSRIQPFFVHDRKFCGQHDGDYGKRWDSDIVSNISNGVMCSIKCDRASQNGGQPKLILGPRRTMLSLYCITITLTFAAIPIQCNALESDTSSTNLLAIHSLLRFEGDDV